MTEEQTPRTFGRYEVIGRIGAGGMGVVWRARDPQLGRQVAVKAVTARLKSADTVVERFRREALALARLSHPNIVRVFDAGQEQGTLFYVMELLEGRGLDARTPRPDDSEMAQPPPPVFDSREFLDTFTPLADALAVVHKNGLIHRDIKPANILVGVAERGAVLTDFGLIRMEEKEGLTLEGLVVGTGLYMAPEQARGDVPDPANDVYGLGACMWEFATGRIPFFDLPRSALLAARTVAELAPIAKAAPLVPGPIAAIIDRAVKLERGDRIATARELHRALIKARRELFPEEHPQPGFSSLSGSSLPGARPAAPPQPRRSLTAAACAVALAAAGGAGWWHWGRAGLQRPEARPAALAPTVVGAVSPALAPGVDRAQPETGAVPARIDAAPLAAESAVVVAPPGSCGKRIAMAARGHELLMLWLTADGTIAARRSADRGRSWTAPPLDGKAQASPEADLALLSRESGIQVAFQGLDGGGRMRNLTLWSGPELAAWEAALPLGEGAWSGGGVALAQAPQAGRGEPIVAAWHRHAGGGPWLAWRTPPAGAWSDPVSPAWDGRHQKFSVAVTPGGGAVLAWEQEETRADVKRIVVSRTTGPSRAWSAGLPLHVNSTGYDRIVPVLLAVGDRLYLSWSENDLPAYPLMIGLSLDLGQRFQCSRRPLWPFAKHPRTALAGEGSRLWAAWTDTSNDELVYSASTDQGRTWIRPRIAGRIGDSPTPPALTVAQGGIGWLGWVDAESRAMVMRLP